MPIPFNFDEIAPAALIGVIVTGLVTASHLLPFGETTMLVRTADPSAEAALSAAAASDASLVDIPAPGFAVLHGDASRVRASMGLATLWTGSSPCSTTP